MSKLVIVESPTKAKTITKFLGKDYKVESSFGHIRDLPKSAMGIDIEKDFTPNYVIPKEAKKRVNELKKLAKTADEIILATDEDREGEAIAWHLVSALGLKDGEKIKRIVFHEITKSAIEEAIANPRNIDQKLVNAQQARRILDRLVGYTVSPLVWKKVAYGLSAGRVQSAGLRLLVERERKRLEFKKSTYWDLKAELEKSKQKFEAKLTTVDGKRIATGKDFDETTGKLKDEKTVLLLKGKEAKAVLKRVDEAEWKVKEVTEKQVTNHPQAPFITSTLQQEGNRKLGMSARETMRAAQTLYERGLITYMRTDSPALSGEAITGARGAVEQNFGSDYLSPKARNYSSKSKSAQEAHEAIRPAGRNFKNPKTSGLNGRELSVYDLIWKRTLATQMKEAKKLALSVKIEAADTIFTANGMRITFPGFLKIYAEGVTGKKSLDEQEVILPELKQGTVVQKNRVEAVPHETKPPARFTEASLVQRLEKEGIGRPSTYASIISTIINRNYAYKSGHALVPTFTGFAVTQLLEQHFHDLVDYEFTSGMEESLDEIAVGHQDWLPYLKKFYLGEKGLEQQVKIKEEKIDPETTRTVDLIPLKGIKIKVGRFGPYLTKSNGEKSKDPVNASIPEGVAPGDISEEFLQELITASEEGPKTIGNHPESGEPIYVMLGRFGPYVQLGEQIEGEKKKPRRASVPKEINYQQITLEEAVKLLILPKELGKHPETGKVITTNVGRFGPYIVHDDDFRSLKKDDDVYTITLERALEILAEEKKSRRGKKILREIGEHPKTKKKITVYDGRYGPYLKYGTKNVGLPKGQDHEKLTLDEAVEIIKNYKK